MKKNIGWENPKQNNSGSGEGSYDDTVIRGQINIINNEIDELSEELEKKANTDHIWNMDNMGQDIKDAIAESNSNSGGSSYNDTELRNKINALDKELDALDEEVGELNNKLSTKANVSTLNSAIQTIDGKLSTKVEVETLNDEISTLNGKINKKVESNHVWSMSNMGQDVKDSISNLIYDDTTLRNQITTINGQINTINGLINTISNKVEQKVESDHVWNMNNMGQDVKDAIKDSEYDDTAIRNALNEKVDANHIWSMANMGTDIRNAIANGSGGGGQELVYDDTALRNQINTLDGKVDTLEEEFNALNEEVGTLNNELNAKANTSTLNSEINTINNKLATKVETETFNSQVSTLNTEINKKVESSHVWGMNNMGTDVKTAITNATYDDTEIKGQISTINNSLSKKVESSYVWSMANMGDDIKSAISNVSYDDTEIKSQISTINNKLANKVESDYIWGMNNMGTDVKNAITKATYDDTTIRNELNEKVEADHVWNMNNMGQDVKDAIANSSYNDTTIKNQIKTINTTLANKVEASHIWGMDNMGQDVKDAIANIDYDDTALRSQISTINGQITTINNTLSTKVDSNYIWNMNNMGQDIRDAIAKAEYDDSEISGQITAINNTLATKVDGSHIWNMNNMGQDVKNAITNATYNDTTIKNQINSLDGSVKALNDDVGELSEELDGKVNISTLNSEIQTVNNKINAKLDTSAFNSQLEIINNELDQKVESNHVWGMDNMSQEIKDALSNGSGQGANFVTYEEFGAVCDGRYDDGVAIKLAHQYANEHNLKVMALSKTYYIKETSEIPIQTNTDFNGATFIIDDTLDLNRYLPVFRVTSKYNPITINNPNFTINKSTRRISELAGYGNCFMKVINENKIQYIRKGLDADDGRPQCDYLEIDDGGYLLNEVIWDFEEITQIVLYPMDETFLTINNGNFITKVNATTPEYQYFERNFIVNRSNVIFDNITHELQDETPGSPYNGIIHGQSCCNLYIKNCILHPRTVYRNEAGTTMGTYDIRFDEVLGLRLENVKDRSFDEARWGVMASNYCKDIIIEKCRLTRIDAHKGVDNIRIRDCLIGHDTIQLTGSGRCEIENVTIYNSYQLVGLRSDYGSSWEGDMIIKNVKLYCTENTSTVVLVDFSNDGTHDFGYDCYYPKRLILEDIYVDDTVPSQNANYNGVFIICNSSGRTGTINDNYLYPYRFSEYIECKNLKTKSNKGYKPFYTNMLNLYSETEFYYEEVEKIDDTAKNINIIPNAKIILDDVQLSEIPNGASYSTTNLFHTIGSVNGSTDSYLSNTHRVVPEIIIRNCKNVFGCTSDIPMVLRLEDCVINHLVNRSNSTRMIGSATNCLFQPKLASSNTSVTTNWLGFSFINCCFDRVSIGGAITDNADNIVGAYAFLYNLRIMAGGFIYARVRMVNCRIIDFDFSSMSSRIKYFTFKFGNHDFEYHLCHYGQESHRPDPTLCPVPAGYTFYNTTASALQTWNGTTWV